LEFAFIQVVENVLAEGFAVEAGYGETKVFKHAFYLMEFALD